jgi:hypothetical protein
MEVVAGEGALCMGTVRPVALSPAVPDFTPPLLVSKAA